MIEKKRYRGAVGLSLVDDAILDESGEDKRWHDAMHHIHVVHLSLDLLREDIERLDIREEVRSELLMALDRIPDWRERE